MTPKPMGGTSSAPSERVGTAAMTSRYGALDDVRWPLDVADRAVPRALHLADRGMRRGGRRAVRGWASVVAHGSPGAGDGHGGVGRSVRALDHPRRAGH